MCKAPKPPPVKEPDKPEFLRNPHLDQAFGASGIINSLRTGRSALRVPLAGGLPSIQNPITGMNSPPSISSNVQVDALAPVGRPDIRGRQLTSA